MYRIHFANGGSETSAEIRANLNPEIPGEAKHIARIDEIERSGIRYSHEDYDVLSAARHAVWRRIECERLGLPHDCGPNEFWLAKAGHLPTCSLTKCDPKCPKVA